MRRWRFVLPALLVVAVAAVVVLLLRPSPSPKPTTTPPITAPTATPLPPPQVVGVNIEPPELRFTGGQVRVEAAVRAATAVREVGVIAVDQEGREVTKGVGNLVGETWQMVVVLPPNTHTDGQPLIYRIMVRVVDTTGQVAEKEGQVRVLAPDLPPRPPF